VRLTGRNRTGLQTQVEADFRAFVDDARFPCLAGKGALHRNEVTLRAYGALGSLRGIRRLTKELTGFVRGAPVDGTGLRTFVAVFPERVPTSELEFEAWLWRQLQLLHEHDEPGIGWDPAASADPENAEFSFSFAGRALFVVGLHPESSRLARRFRWPALAFNPRAQFERLRSDGRYDRLRSAVRERDVALQGTPNPNLADFGERSEARQYSGRATEAECRCPFHRKEA
jgi:FPC/CPF motif-containing protein YcgG